jgi:hypothetical protein
VLAKMQRIADEGNDECVALHLKSQTALPGKFLHAEACRCAYHTPHANSWQKRYSN